MSRSMLVLAVILGVLLGGAAPATAQETDIVERLEAVPGLTVVGELPTAVPGYRFFALTFHQPADHQRPWLGSFEQRLRLMYRGTDRPTLLHTGGYGVRTAATLTEVARLIGGNQLNVEHRFFTPSIPDPANWTKLTIWQAATDHHRLIQALEPLFSQRWLSAGSSKGGMATVYHRRFYPYDVDGSVAYVAPNDAEYPGDWKYDRFLEEVGDDPSCVQRLQAVQYEALGPRRKEMLARFTAWAAANGQTFHKTLGTADRTFEFTVLDTAWTFWQNTGQTACPTVPERSASTDALYAFIDTAIGWDGLHGPEQRVLPPVLLPGGEPARLSRDGVPAPAQGPALPGPLPGALVRPPLPGPRGPVGDPRDRPLGALVRRRAAVRLRRERPVGRRALRAGPLDARHARLRGRGRHPHANITQLPQAEEDQATATVRRWAGNPPLPAAPPTVQRQAAPEPEEEEVVTGARP